MRKVFFLSLIVLAAGTLSAKVDTAPIFADNMVLQRGMNVPVWGTADAGEKVTVNFADQTVSTEADAKGKWMVKLAPLAASKENRTLTVSGKDNKLEFKNVLVGEVWLCSGQSNMEMPLWTTNPRWRANNGDKDAAACKNDLIRFAKMAYLWGDTPHPGKKRVWMSMDPKNAVSFSATAFYFSRELFSRLEIPIGLVTSHWGGTRIEPWTPQEGFDSVPELKTLAASVRAKIPGTAEYAEGGKKLKKIYSDYLAKVDAALKSGKVLPQAPAFPQELTINYDQQRGAHQQPTMLYNRMIYPIVPFAFRGAIWYQGCSNMGEHLIYNYKMQALINGWRTVFQNPDMRFYFVQIAPFHYSKSSEGLLPLFWESQEKFVKANDQKVGMALTVDIGDYWDIHPHNKTDVGKRLANLALRRDYGKTDIVADAPTLKSSELKDNKYILTFDNVKNFEVKNANPKEKAFEVAGVDGSYVPATYTLNGNQIIVSGPEGLNVKMVRYLWGNCVTARIFSESGLPLSGFRVEPKISPEEMLGELGKGAKLVYTFDGKTGRYVEDFRKAPVSKISKIIYFVSAISNTGKSEFVAVKCDAFTQDVEKLSVPQQGSKIFFHQKVKNMLVAGNSPNVENGTFAEGGIEIWPGNYHTPTSRVVPGGDARTYDFNDSPTRATAGYGCLQIHNFMRKQTIFALNNIGSGKSPAEWDFGIGSNTRKNQHPDWTFTKNARNFNQIKISVFIVE